MELAAAHSPASERRWSTTQIFFAIVALGWIPFVLSAMSYRSECVVSMAHFRARVVLGGFGFCEPSDWPHHMPEE